MRRRVDKYPPPVFDLFPPELTCRPQWTMWKAVPQAGDKKPRKLPVTTTNAAGSTTDPDKWCTFDQARAAFETSDKFAGAGYVFTNGDPFIGIDFDDCVAGGVTSPEVLEIIEQLGGYAEISPSGRGVKVVCLGKWPRATGSQIVAPVKIEVYDHGRYFALTGDIHEASRCEGLRQSRQDAIDKLHARYFANGQAVAKTNGAAKVYEDGERNNRLASMAGGLRKLGLNGDELYDALQGLNRSRCKPPLPDAEVRSVAKSIGNYSAPPGAGAPTEPIITPVPITELPDTDPIDWIYHPFVARGMATLVVGIWKGGKTTLMAYLARAMGGHPEALPGDVAQGNVLILSEESPSMWSQRRDEIGIGPNVFLHCRPFIYRPDSDTWHQAILETAELVGQY